MLKIATWTYVDVLFLHSELQSSLCFKDCLCSPLKFSHFTKKKIIALKYAHVSVTTCWQNLKVLINESDKF